MSTTPADPSWWDNRPLVHARRDAKSFALCGLEPGVGQWSRKRAAVTCARCAVEADRRIEAVRARR
jgi:hypothetical protein